MAVSGKGRLQSRARLRFGFSPIPIAPAEQTEKVAGGFPIQLHIAAAHKGSDFERLPEDKRGCGKLTSPVRLGRHTIENSRASLRSLGLA